MKRFLKYFLVFVIAFVVGILYSQIRSPVTFQPIKFNHKKHVVENELECTFCHKGAKESRFATFPSIKTCIECHEEALTQSKEEEKIRIFYKKNMEIPWQKILRMPEHVYFSHYRHTVLGNIECTQCHGNMPERTFPPDKPLKRLRMKDCINCHKKNKVTTDCNACHK